MAEEMDLKKGEMVWKGLFGGSLSWNGVKLDVLKSGMQKYLRRREKEKMIWCMIELDLFSECGNERGSKAIRSNMLNRLVVMCVEELLFCEWDRILKINKRIERWEKGGRKDRKKLIEICLLLVNGRMLRLNSDLNAVYGRAVNMGLEEVKGFVNRDRIGCEVKKYEKKGDNKEVLEDLSKLISCLDEKNDEVFYWVDRILKKEKNGVKGGNRYKRRKCSYVIWEVLFDRVGENRYLRRSLEVLMGWYNKDRRERFCFLFSGVNMVMKKDDIDWDEKRMENRVEDRVSISEVEEWYRINKEEGKLMIDDYVIDMHCGEGRKKGSNAMDFFNEGSKVIGEDEEFKREEYRVIYRKLKEDDLKEGRGKGSKRRKGKVKGKRKCNFELEEKLEKKRLEMLLGYERVEDLNDCLVVNSNCGKAMVFVNKKGKKWKVYKEVNRGFNYGRDCMVMDKCKKVFGIERMRIKRIRSDKIVRRVNRKVLSWVDNMEVKECKDGVYLEMKFFENVGNLCNNKRFINDEVLEKLFKIGLFRCGIFKSSDFHLVNILVNNEGEILSIDENNIGKRVVLFGKNAGRWIWNRKEFFNKRKVDEMLDEFLSNEKVKIKRIVKMLKRYGLKDKINEVFENWKGLRKRVYREFREMKMW